MEELESLKKLLANSAETLINCINVLQKPELEDKDLSVVEKKCKYSMLEVKYSILKTAPDFAPDEYKKKFDELGGNVLIKKYEAAMEKFKEPADITPTDKDLRDEIEAIQI